MGAFRSISVSAVLCLLSTVVTADPSAQTEWLQNQLQSDAYQTESPEVLARRAQLIEAMQQQWNQNPGFNQHSSLLPGVVGAPQQQAPATPKVKDAPATQPSRTRATTTSAQTQAPLKPAPVRATQPAADAASAPDGSTTIEITNATLEPQIAQQTQTQTQTQTATQQQQTAVRYLTWNVPTQRTDGTRFLLKELGGYFLIVKNKKTGGTSQVHITNPGANSYSLRNYRRGSYAFSIQSYDLRGLVSPYSPWVSVTI